MQHIHRHFMLLRIYSLKAAAFSKIRIIFEILPFVKYFKVPFNAEPRKSKTPPIIAATRWTSTSRRVAAPPCAASSTLWRGESLAHRRPEVRRSTRSGPCPARGRSSSTRTTPWDTWATCWPGSTKRPPRKRSISINCWANARNVSFGFRWFCVCFVTKLLQKRLFRHLAFTKTLMLSLCFYKNVFCHQAFTKWPKTQNKQTKENFKWGF